jgi:hypothetical protein
MLANAKPSSPLFYAAQRGDLATVQALLREPHAQIECDRAFRVATRNGWHLVVQLLCASVPFPWKHTLNAGEWSLTPLVLADYAGNEKTAETIVKMCGDVPLPTLLHHAIIRGSTATTEQLLERLLSANACVDVQSVIMYHGAAIGYDACSSALVKVLVRAKAHIDVHGSWYTALEHACRLCDARYGLVKFARTKMLQKAGKWSQKSVSLNI